MRSSNYLQVVNLILLLCILLLLLLLLRRHKKEYFQTNKSHTAVVFELNGGAGFFSMYFMLCTAYIYAKTQGYDFYVKLTGWHYTYERGWHDYMTSLQVWDPSYKYDKIETYTHGSMGNIPGYYIKDYEDATREIFTITPEIQNKVDAYISTLPQVYDSLYVRRGDKVKGPGKEMDEFSMQDILNKTNITHETQDLYVQTDDYTVIEELQTLLPNCKIHTLTTPDIRGSYNMSLHNAGPDERYNHTVNLLIETFAFVGGRTCWTDIRSSVGRMHKVLAYDKVHLYPEDIMTRDFKGNIAYMY
jgi:hypothetical protein